MVMNNYAFIDGQNLHKAIKAIGWDLDYRRFRIYTLLSRATATFLFSSQFLRIKMEQ
jgi:hypothetical protein